MTQHELATAAGVSMTSVALFCGGYRPERSAALDRVNAVLDEALAEAKA